MAMSFGSLFLISLAAGLVGALTGMGGGVILVPALTFLGIDIKHAIAVSMVSVIATSSGSAAAYVRDRITNLKVGMFLEMFTICGALAEPPSPYRQSSACCSSCLDWCCFFLRRPCSSSALGGDGMRLKTLFRTGWNWREAITIRLYSARSRTRVRALTWAGR